MGKKRKFSSVTSITSTRREKESVFELFHGECAHIDEEIPAAIIFNLKIAIFFCRKSVKYINRNATTKMVAIPPTKLHQIMTPRAGMIS